MPTQAWYLNENPYPFVPPHVLEAADSVRASLPNKYCDPRVSADLFEECLFAREVLPRLREAAPVPVG
jgi:hypothetical protein